MGSIRKRLGGRSRHRIRADQYFGLPPVPRQSPARNILQPSDVLLAQCRLDFCRIHLVKAVICGINSILSDTCQYPSREGDR